jgi:tRNA pseudouridine32 synthase/23S rRNA pseudouridine746 synthase/23S rRNA pseudouridine1911/1915/1917 synthase
MKYESVNDTTLLEVLKELFPESSRRTLQTWVKAGRISVDDVIAKHENQKVSSGQIVVVGPRTERPIDVPFAPLIPVLYRDHHLIVINKPEGLLSVASDDPQEKHAFGVLKEVLYPQRFFPVHRLDRETSGVMVFACSEKARDLLKTMFERHELEREYVAVVEGILQTKTGTWQSHLAENSQYVVYSTDDLTTGKHAITHYCVEHSGNERSLLLCRLETGRKNQIRVHCKDAKHPVVGDIKYGATTNPINRICLHARLLRFKHPLTEKPLSFEVPPPDAFLKLCS